MQPIALFAGLEQQELMRENLLLQTRVKETQAQADDFRAQQASLMSKVEKVKNAFICQICQFRNVRPQLSCLMLFHAVFSQIDLVLVKCGHVICKECEEQLR